MDIRKLQRVIVDGLEDVKAQNIVVFNTEHLSPLFERVIVASGTSNRQTRSLAASVRDAVKSAGEPAPRTEGEDNGEWIIVDCGAAVVHVMQPAIREYYHLEELWGDKPVRMKIGAAPPARLVKAEAPAEERRASSRHANAASAAKAPARRGGPAAPSRGKPAAPARAGSPASARGGSSAPSRPKARKAAPARHVVRTVGVKSAAKKAASSARPTTTRRPAAKKTSAKR
jgi:ribosome-associated protein